MTAKPDLVILGSGSTAFAAALRAQSLGAKVLMIEKGELGGTCVNWGCIPSKTLIRDALFPAEAKRGASRGVRVREEPVDFTEMMRQKDEVVRHLRQVRYLDIIRKVPGLEVLKGTARFLSPRTVGAGSQVIECDRFLIATGGYPRIVKLPGLSDVDYLTSRSALMLKSFPESLLIVGGGVIALELGQMFLRLGTKVTVLEHGKRLLPQVDADVAQEVHRSLVAEGMEIHVGAAVCSLAREGAVVSASVQLMEGERQLRAQRLLLATGTAPATDNIGLDLAGVEVDGRGFVRVDGQMRTTAPGIWAAGDVTGGLMIATAGAREGIVAVDNMFDPGCGCSLDYQSVPMAIFTDPEIGMVGHSEESAREAGIEFSAATLRADQIPKAHVTGNTAGLIKMLADPVTMRLLGVHLACDRGADIINEAALAIRARLTVDDLASTLHVYPSMAEGLRLCAQSFRRDVSRLSCCAE
ncbi:mercury(II) reductase [Geobacter sp. DSM 9736]|uniref:mercury(II) reductase n=1 Tax=Geobacter sp. DSM 9736 TaxID=1277350 RepID=UPI000B50607C|nr:mercury(II) reductase [Geobacter sp. DSM 9736]SNB46863.1 mercuric reductase [Geobacter sp. DSM 9736]